MKKLALILALTTAIPANAGGPVIEEEPLVAGDYDEQRVNPLWIIGGLVVACLILCGGDDDPAPVTPDTPKPPAPEPQPDPGPKPCVYEGGGC